MARAGRAGRGARGARRPARPAPRSIPGPAPRAGTGRRQSPARRLGVEGIGQGGVRRAGKVHPPENPRSRSSAECSPSPHPTWVSRHPDSPPGTSTRQVAAHAPATATPATTPAARATRSSPTCITPRLGDTDASHRLAEHNRALTTGVAGAGGVPPHWLAEEFDALARQGRGIANAVRNIPLGDDLRPITLPRQTAGTDGQIAQQATENTHPGEADAWTSTTDVVTPKPFAGLQVRRHRRRRGRRPRARHAVPVSGRRPSPRPRPGRSGTCGRRTREPTRRT